MTVIQNLVLIGVSVCITGASWWLIRAARSVIDSARSLVAVGESLGLSSQRLIGEAALIDGLTRDLAHGHGLHYPDEKFDMGLPDPDEKFEG